jgi:hypothetical protein
MIYMSVRNFRQLLPLYLACYAIWLALSALGVWLIFQLRPVLFALAIWLRLNPWQVRAIDQYGVVAMGLIWLVAILLLEHSLRQGVEKNQLWARAARASVMVAVALALCYALQALIA